MKYPSVGMKKAFDKMNEYKLTYIRYYNNHTLEHRTSIITGIETWEYAHYNTLIGTISILPITKKKQIKLSGQGWSSTDRDNFNGLLRLLNIDSVCVVKRHDNLYFKKNGEILSDLEIVLYD